VVLCALPGALAAQSDTVSCRHCEDRGESECREHPRGLLDLELQVRRCSVATECRRCAGALVVDCRHCERPEVESSAEARRRLAQQWLAARRETVDVHTRGEAILHCSTEHVDLVFSLEPMTVGREKLDSHRLMHLYAQRLEELRAEFVATFALEESDFPAQQDGVDPRIHVYMFDDGRDHREIAPRVTGMGSQGVSAKLMGATLAYCMHHDRSAMRDDAAVHRSVVHNVAHLLLSGIHPVVWVGNQGHGWIDEGVAHWFEFRVDGLCTNFCFEEVGITPGQGFKGGKWRIAIRRLAEAGALRKFTELYQKNSDELDFEAHAHAFAWVDFLISTGGGAKFMDFVRSVKRKTETREALTQVYGFGPLQFDERFEAWVRETYPLREGGR